MKKLLLSLAVAFSMYGSAEAGIIRGTLPDGTEIRADVTPKDGDLPAELMSPHTGSPDIYLPFTYTDPDVKSSDYIIFLGPLDKTWTTEETLWYIKTQLAFYYNVFTFELP